MLVLSRRLWERIRIGKDITITFVQINENTVKLVFEAPDDVNITHRRNN